MQLGPPHIAPPDECDRRCASRTMRVVHGADLPDFSKRPSDNSDRGQEAQPCPCRRPRRRPPLVQRSFGRRPSLSFCQYRTGSSARLCFGGRDRCDAPCTVPAGMRCAESQTSACPGDREEPGRIKVPPCQQCRSCRGGDQAADHTGFEQMMTPSPMKTVGTSQCSTRSRVSMTFFGCRAFCRRRTQSPTQDQEHGDGNDGLGRTESAEDRGVDGDVVGRRWRW